MWSYDWRCNLTAGAPLSLTLNNGVMVVDGRNAAVHSFYGHAYGLGMKLLALKKNGWVSWYGRILVCWSCDSTAMALAGGTAGAHVVLQ